MFEDEECSGEEIGRITTGWEVCYPYSGWKGWVVVQGGVACKSG